MGAFVVVIGTVILFFQWIHPLKYLKLNLLISKKKYRYVSFIGGFFIVGLIFWFIFLTKNIEILGENSSKTFIVFSTFFFTTYLFYNFFVTIYAFRKSKEKKNSFHRMIILIPFAPVFIVVIYFVLYFLFTLFGTVFDVDIVTVIRISNNDSMLVFKMLIRLLLISFTTVMAFIVIQYIETITEMQPLKNDEDKKKRRIRIEKRLSWRSLSLVFLVGTMISFFHFAEIDTSLYDDQFKIVFQRTLDVFQMIASALFIPIFLNVLLDKSKLRNANED